MTDTPTGAGETGVERRDPDVADDWTRFESPSTAVVEAAAAATDRTATGLAPLQHYVDTEAMNAVMTDQKGEQLIELTFSYDGLDVRVDSAGQVAVWIHGQD